MDANVQELTAKAEKLNIDSGTPKYSTNWHEAIEGMWAATGRAYYNPKTDTNWCHLPMEMRVKCINEMDLETRMSLRRTSKTEKSLVKSAKKCFLREFIVHVDSGDLDVYAENYKKTYKGNPVHVCQNVMQNVVNILEHCEIGYFEFFTNEDSEEKMQPICDFRTKDAPFCFKTFDSNIENPQIIKFFLGNCKGVKEIHVQYFVEEENEINELLQLPSVINAKLLEGLLLWHMDSSLLSFVQKWIDNDADDRHLEIEMFKKDLQDKDDTLELFASFFADRVISNDKYSVLIRTDNDQKQIELVMAEEGDFEAIYFRRYLYRTITPPKKTVDFWFSDDEHAEEQSDED